IGGGYDKKSTYDEWIVSFGTKIKCLVLIGETADAIEACANAHGFDAVVRADSLEQAVRYCHEHAKSGDAVLLSPACASWDMFDSYEQRGKLFKEYVRNL
ncbi:MAG: UDP-N-acetylmuramoyl-L-alanine--D-glutamate ligase, partial [Lachnospiraceae bacterium]|nr:UDP-N-acetylmuramoyl-L-alanine--D-glutamate ligase [Lachnospiraceae bacterium]